MNRLLKKISLKEGEDCYFDITSGQINLCLNDVATKKHEGYWCKTNGSATFFQNETKADNIIGYIQHETYGCFWLFGNYKMISFKYIEIMKPYRKKEDEESNAFDILINKFADEVVYKLVDQYGEDNICFSAFYVNSNLKDRMNNEYLPLWNIKNLADFALEKMKEDPQELIHFLSICSNMSTKKYESPGAAKEITLDKIKDLLNQHNIIINDQINPSYNNDKELVEILKANNLVSESE